MVDCAFTISFIADGILYTFGTMYGQLKERFEATDLEVSWMMSLLMLFFLLSGKLHSPYLESSISV